ncbi:MAG TPA: hypothetical protein DEP61_04765, partial [Lachnospiraceae bacterium]|nr:hypothetical protein [Lachnospiraceae bacterium]
ALPSDILDVCAVLDTPGDANGSTSGTEGRSLRLEAVQLRLTGDIANYYDVYYRAHIQNYGWLGWTCNGQSAGSS